MFVELPLLTAETYLLWRRGVINWDDQMWDMLLHIVFVANIPFQTLLDTMTLPGTYLKKFIRSVGCTLLSAILACIVYSPTSIALVGFKPFKKAGLEVFESKHIKLTRHTKNILLVLAQISYYGQPFFILLVIVILVLFIFMYCRWKTFVKSTLS